MRDISYFRIGNKEKLHNVAISRIYLETGYLSQHYDPPWYINRGPFSRTMAFNHGRWEQGWQCHVEERVSVRLATQKCKSALL